MAARTRATNSKRGDRIMLPRPSGAVMAFALSACTEDVAAMEVQVYWAGFVNMNYDGIGVERRRMRQSAGRGHAVADTS